MNLTENNEQLFYRDQIAQLTEDLLLGPLYGDKEVIEENPLRFYSTGILYPPFFGVINDTNPIESEFDGNQVSENENIPPDDEQPAYAGPRPGHFKSNIGITGAIRISENINLKVQISFDQYDKSNGENKKYVLRKESFDFYLNHQDLNKELTSFKSLEDKLEKWNYLHVPGNANIAISYLVRSDKKNRDDNNENVKLISIRLENTSANPEKNSKINKDKVLPLILFRTKIKLTIPEGFESLRKAVKSFNQEASFEFLFRNRKNYSSGVNISTFSDYDSMQKKCYSIETEYAPKSNQLVLETDPEDFTKKKFQDLLDVTKLLTSKDLPKSLSSIAIEYEKWIDNNFKTLHQNEAKKIKERCAESLYRIKKGIQLLEDEGVKEVWLDSISAIFSQYKWNNKGKKDFSFRLFQIAFFLMVLPDLINGTNNDENFCESVDLLWIPAGGGKTEAYLAISGFIILWNRKQKRNGVSVLTRYTLRLLTSQQFQRSASMVMALELIRRKKKIYGETPISIGMLVGGESTPNDQIEYKKKLDEWRITHINPFPVEYCPVCLEKLENEEWNHQKNINSKNSYLSDIEFDNSRKKEARIRCLNLHCEFLDKSREQTFLPIYFIDDLIFKYKPDFLLATVDKLAQIPFKDNKYLDLFNPPPSLILQDELHLINSSLGTVFANYESGLHTIFKANEVNNEKPPKIITSTATPKNSEDQIRLLFGRDSRVFPAGGADIEDFFFSRFKENINKSRKYIGFLASGMPEKNMERNISAAILASRFILLGDMTIENEKATIILKENARNYKVLTSYFNALRELGGYTAMVEDDIPIETTQFLKRILIGYSKDNERFSFMSESFKNMLLTLDQNQIRELSFVIKINGEELTSRNSFSEIKSLLNKFKGLDNTSNLPDVLSSTNMISVGIDIEQMNIMLVCGQPKSASEYIQSTSRTGRTYPGLVCVSHNPSKLRDLNHYEFFEAFHKSFYKYTDPTTITPFSRPALERTLAAQLIILINMHSEFKNLVNIRSEDVKKNNAALNAKDKFKKVIISLSQDWNQVKYLWPSLSELYDIQKKKYQALNEKNYSKDDSDYFIQTFRETILSYLQDFSKIIENAISFEIIKRVNNPYDPNNTKKNISDFENGLISSLGIDWTGSYLLSYDRIGNKPFRILDSMRGVDAEVPVNVKPTSLRSNK